MQEKCNI